MHETKILRDQAAGLRQIASMYRGHRLFEGPRLVTITSGKGGVGKSTIAINLGIALGGLGNRVLLVDGDTNLGGLDVMLGISPDIRLNMVMAGSCTIDDAIVDVTPMVALLPGSSGDPGYPQVDETQREEFLRSLADTRTPFDVVVIDTGAGMTAEIVSYAVHADDVVVVTTPDPVALIDAYAMIKIISMAKPEASVGVIMNNAATPQAAQEGMRNLTLAVRHFIGRDIRSLGAVPVDEMVREATIGQYPVVHNHPTTVASRAIMAIAKQFRLHTVVPSEQSGGAL